MTLEEILSLAEQDSPNLYQFEEETLITYADQIQKMAYRKDLEAFKVWNQYLRIFHTLVFDPDNFSAISSDVGKNVIGATSGAVGELISYDSTEKTYLVFVTSGEFEADETVSVQAGTGTGVITAAEIFFGPYDLSEVDPACRKLIGVTSYTDRDIFNCKQHHLNDRDDFWEIGRVNAVNKTFTFVNEPSLEADYYRWVYYLLPPTISSISSEVILPEEFHHTLLLQGIVALQDNAENGDRFVIPSQLLKPMMDEFWEAMEDQHLDIGGDDHRRIGW